MGLDQVLDHPVPQSERDAHIAREDREPAIAPVRDGQVEILKMGIQIIIGKSLFRNLSPDPFRFWLPVFLKALRFFSSVFSHHESESLSGKKYCSQALT